MAKMVTGLAVKILANYGDLRTRLVFHQFFSGRPPDWINCLPCFSGMPPNVCVALLPCAFASRR